MAQVTCQKFQMPNNTFIYGEIVEEYAASGGSKAVVFHMIDALILGGKVVRDMPLSER